MNRIGTTIRAQVALMLNGGLAERLRREEGQGFVEYALILSLIALVVIVAIAFLSGKIGQIFSDIGNAL